MKSIFLTVGLLAVFSLNSFGQENHGSCKHDDPTTESLKQAKSLLGNSQKSTDLKIIPVVFHVLHQNGYENITDAQIQDVMRILNEDFQKLNPDTSLVTAPFDTIIGKVNFEFRLATIDPNGNATNGIDRIFSPLTNMANQSSMINQWNPLSYVNIWVVKTLSYQGVAAFTSNPLVSTDPCNQGIVILHDYTGSIGTASLFAGHSLTHEMGHYFGLFHTFGNQDMGITCDYSDGVYDTPVTKGNSYCDTAKNSCDDTDDAASFAYWGFDPRDNVENFMDFTFCIKMFTNGQVELMRNVAESPLYGRDHLWTTANLIATGTGPGVPLASTALPHSNFSILSNNNSASPYTYGMICAGDNVQFTIQNGLTSSATTTYSWNFPGGTPPNSADENPVVTYTNPGYYDVSLMATNPNGFTATARTAVIYVSGSWPEFTGPTVQDFNISGNFWQSQNMNEDYGYFQRIATNGTQNTGCFLLGNHYETDSMNCYQGDPSQINQSKDNLISPAFDLSTTTGVTVSFDYAYGSAAIPDSATEVLKVYYSRDCGKTWIQKQMIKDTSLVTAFAPQNSAYAPAQNEWKHVSFQHNSLATDTKTRFKFEFTASNYSNNFYIDNFVIDGVLGISDNELSGIEISPNPSQAGGIITISGLNASKTSVKISDLQGKLVYQKELAENEVHLRTDLKAGCYLVEVAQNGSRFLTRLIVE